MTDLQHIGTMLRKAAELPSPFQVGDRVLVTPKGEDPTPATILAAYATPFGRGFNVKCDDGRVLKYGYTMERLA